jgi:hypothetical protein
MPPTHEARFGENQMAQYRKKPVVIEARPYLNDESSYALLHWINEGQHKTGKKFADWTNGVLTVPTLEGEHVASVGDWIICGVAGEFYPCKPDIFAATYEAA